MAEEEESDVSSTIVTISELIDGAFGDPEVNIVHHKHIQTILYIIARQLRILERRVAVRLTPIQVKAQESSSSLSVTEVKLQAMAQSQKTLAKKRQSTVKPRSKQPDGRDQQTKSVSDETSTAISSSKKSSSYGAEPSNKKSTIDKGSAPGKKSRSEKHSVLDKSSPEDDATSVADKKTSRGKKSTSGKKSLEDDISELTADKTTKTSEITSAGKPSAVDETSTADKKSRAGKKTKAGKPSPEDDISDDEASPDDVIPKAGKKSGAGKAKGVDETLTDKTITTGKSSAVDETSTADKKSSANKRKTGDKISERAATRGRAASERADSTPIDPQEYQKILDRVEEMREQELRVIHQRVDSREEQEKTPTPLASMDSLEATYEKLLVVERIPPEEAKARTARGRSTATGESAPRISVVTQEQFDELAYLVRQIQKKLAPTGTADFPENAQLMEELRKGASLTDAMAALQLSARLEATEKTLTNLLSLVTDLAGQMPGYQPTKGVTDDIEVLFGADGKGKQVKGGDVAAGAKSPKRKSQKEPDTHSDDMLKPSTQPEGNITKIDDIITIDQLEAAMQNVYDNIMKQVTDKTTQSVATAETALKLLIGKLEKKIDNSLNLGNKMETLEQLVSNYSEQINVLDTGLSSQLTYFQEELTQMHHDLETGLETMAEALANAGGDVTAISELNAHFNDLQVDIDDAVQRQKDLRNIQTTFTTDLDGLRAQIEMLRETKSDRDEVVDALRDKAGIGDLNRLISHEQFDAVSGDIERRIANAYDKFNNQEIVWQKAIDDIWRELSEKADIIQVDSMRDEINHYLEEVRKKMKFIIDIVGEPIAAAVTKQLSRDAACLSCSAPAMMKAEENTTPLLPAMRPPAVGAEAPKPREDGDHGCYQGYPVKHQIDPRAHICNRWCGGSHTLIGDVQKSRIPPSITVTSFDRKVGQEKGTDGKMYAVDEQVPKKLCAQCIVPSPSAASKHDIIRIEDPPSFDYHPMSAIVAYDVTPPL